MNQACQNVTSRIFPLPTWIFFLESYLYQFYNLTDNFWLVLNWKEIESNANRGPVSAECRKRSPRAWNWPAELHSGWRQVKRCCEDKSTRRRLKIPRKKFIRMISASEVLSNHLENTHAHAPISCPQGDYLFCPSRAERACSLVFLPFKYFARSLNSWKAYLSVHSFTHFVKFESQNKACTFNTCIHINEYSTFVLLLALTLKHH